MTVVVVGDATLDISVASPSTAVSGGDVPASIVLGPGGQGANVAVRLARRGVSVRLAAPIADDFAGTLLTGLLRDEGIDLCALPAERSALVVALLAPDGERSMLSDRRPIDTASAAAAMIGAAWVHLSGYALADDRGGDELADLVADRGPATRASVAGGSFAVDPELAARIRRRIGRARLDLLVLDRAEAETLQRTATVGALDAARALHELAAITLVTDGANGSGLVCGGVTHLEPAPVDEVPIVDATGAGDAFAAALIAELSGVELPPDAATLRAAVAVASKVGARVARTHGAQGRVLGESSGSS